MLPLLALAGHPAIVAQAQECYNPADGIPQKRALFGDLHVHTSLSMDSYAYGNFNDPNDAYRFAKGEQVYLAPIEVETEDGPVQVGRPIALARPLDFASVTEHSEYLAETNLCTTPGSGFYNSPSCRDFREGNFGKVAELSVCRDYPRFCEPIDRAIWGDIIGAANAHNDPCTFTTLVGYEWTAKVPATRGTSSIHRNVIYRNDNVPDLPISFLEEDDPARLRRALYDTCQGSPERPDCEVLLIPHNSNKSAGRTFDLDEDETFETFAFREAMEPLLEIVQHKGASECTPTSSPDDPYCDFEILQRGVFANPESDAGYFREAVKKGLDRQNSHPTGDNPLRLGILGSTDTHNGTPGATDEADYLGHMGLRDALARDVSGTIVATGTLAPNLIEFNPGGLVGVWALENSRDAVFDALRRRETFATSGPRIKPKLHARWTNANANADVSAATCGQRAREIAAEGTPMGGLMPPSTNGQVPEIAAVALRDPDGTPIEQVQIVKLWIAPNGEAQEQVATFWFDAQNVGQVALLADLPTDAVANGANLDLDTCAQTDGNGKASICFVWTDETYDPSTPAAYYARVLENPSCRHTAHVCAELIDSYTCDGGFQGDDPNLAGCCDPNYRRGIRERAWTSPIYTQAAL